MSETVILCRTDELSSGQARRFDVGGHRIALVRTDDEFHAIGDRCSHENYSLLVRGATWSCRVRMSWTCVPLPR